MLQKLYISNFAIIDELEVEFSEQINIITGETGAGKSILIGALSLVLGQRADSRALMHKDAKCVVEASFDISNYGLQPFFNENDLDYDHILLIRRELTPSGKSRAFVNDTPVKLSLLKELGEQLVNLHSQHETLALNHAQFQLMMIDTLAGHEKLLSEFQSRYQDYRTLQQEISELLEQNSHITDRDYLEFQYRELEEANLDENEQKTLEDELRTLEHAETIKSLLSNASSLLQDADFSALNQLREAGSLIRKAATYHQPLHSLVERTESALIEFQDIADEIIRIQESVALDPERMYQLQERLNLINRLQQKHRVQSNRQLLDIKDAIEKKLKSFDTLEQTLSEKQNRIDRLRVELESLGEKMHASRIKQKGIIEKQVVALLGEVGMPQAKVRIDVEKMPFEKITPRGLDKVTFLFSANRGAPLQELKNVASGGELSRLMLALKSLLAAKISMPTLIFDEIDSGISGETSLRVGALLKQLGDSHQVIIITHQPQIARIGNYHLLVFKTDKDDKTVTQIRKLNEKERIIELAKMIGGDNYSDHALASAKDLLLS
ncbi:MAG: DNA repair protein RecN [Chitinophagales bacterium]|nr:MAG: DNA repair protein RecN [Chitinophagales bacterium]